MIWHSNNQCIGIRISGNAKAYIINNQISDNYDPRSNGTEIYSGMGIYVVETADTKICGNLFFNNGVNGGSDTSGQLTFGLPLRMLLSPTMQ